MARDDRDLVDERLESLTQRTEGVVLPRGLEARLLGRLRRSADESLWDVAWSACRRSLPLALAAALIALGVAIVHDRRLTEAMSHAGDADVGFHTGEP